MSRFYDIQIGAETAPPIGSPSAGASNNAGARFTNQVNGKLDPGALMIELYVPVYGFANPMGYATAKVWGVSETQVAQASDFNGAPITISAGMQRGLPLATADAGFAGVLVAGTVYQAFGNYLGVNQTLDLVITTDGGASQDKPANLAFTWKKGTQLSGMIQQTLTQAYPSLKVNINISSNLVLSADESGFYQTLPQFAAYVKAVSQQIVGGDYPGVDVTLNNGTLNVFDGSSPSNPKRLLFQDLIGQPTWLSAFTVTFTTVMRADIQVGDSVTFPPLASFLTTTTANSQSQARSRLAFSGSWTINNVLHVGNSRAPEAQAWVTVYQAYSNQAPDTATNPQATS